MINNNKKKNNNVKMKSNYLNNIYRKIIYD